MKTTPIFAKGFANRQDNMNQVNLVSDKNAKRDIVLAIPRSETPLSEWHNGRGENKKLEVTLCKQKLKP